MIFRVLPLRFDFVARTPVVFPPGKAGNVFRGAFGIALKRVCCPPECASVATCARRAECAYARLFEPKSDSGPSGLTDWPRPFAMRAAALDGKRIQPGEPFTLDVHVFDLTMPVADYLAAAWQRLGEEGIGPARGRFELRRKPESTAIALDLSKPVPTRRARVRFLTPTELKESGEVRHEPPEFDVLFARLRDRISTLRQLYQEGPLEIDFRAMAARADAVKLTASELNWESTERYSTRTGQTHPLGGMTGWAEYEGDLGEFVPYLEAGYWTGVGRQTVWGKGVINCSVSPATAPQSEAR